MNDQYKNGPSNPSDPDPAADRQKPANDRENPAGGHISTLGTLADEQRIKVLSPSMLVFRRFIRNRLAIVGVLFITAMFLFSFAGGWLMPYGEAQVFTTYTNMSKPFAGVTVNNEYRYVEVPGSNLPGPAQAQFVLAVNNNRTLFETSSASYSLEQLGERFYLISEMELRATAIGLRNVYEITPAEGFNPGQSFTPAFQQAIKDGAETFEADGVTYMVVSERKAFYAYESVQVALATYNVLDMASQTSEPLFNLHLQAEKSIQEGADRQFTADGRTYEIDVADDIGEIYLLEGGQRTKYAVLSRYIVQPILGDVFLTINFKDTVKQAIELGRESFIFNEESPDSLQLVEGDEGEAYTIERNNDRWTVRKIEETLIINAYSYPSGAHWLGTDGNGMDILTRLMYGGRISLMIGFIVVIIEVFIGVILGGIAGYFGKWIDNLLMRVVDIFNCIPSIPIIIIIGAVMDGLRVDPQLRMIYLMLILGFLGWPGIARLVRGQILSLREQEFMVAAEATGLSVYRRIFKHLVPNVIPQLIVISTMSLGGIILTESVLSFLGLGVKFPFASWGNIINAVSNVHVMTNYWFVWIPAGFCILITVLGFNFIGDGLRDAFDPKMKR